MGRYMDSFEKILNNLEAGILFIDNKHCIQWMNKKAEEWFGCLEIGKRRSCYRTMAYSDSVCTVCPTGKAIDYGIPTHYEFRFPCSTSTRALKEVKPSMFEVIGIPVFGSDGNVSMVMEFVMDISEKGIEKIKSEEIMCHIEKMAAIGQLAAGVAHELNTPLGTISIISNELNHTLENLLEKDSAETIQEYLTDLRGEIKRCKVIIQDLLNFSKRGGYHLVEADINLLISKTVDFIRGTKGCDIKITKSFDPSLPLIMTDPDRFRQVAFNVIKNAIEAVEENGAGRVDISTKGEGCFVSVSIKDDGPGIPREDMKRYLSRFLLPNRWEGERDLDSL